MPESPDFEQIARDLWRRLRDPRTTQQIEAEVAGIAEQLRQVWNARGAADIIAIDEVGELVTAIQKLDR